MNLLKSAFLLIALFSAGEISGHNIDESIETMPASEEEESEVPAGEEVEYDDSLVSASDNEIARVASPGIEALQNEVSLIKGFTGSASFKSAAVLPTVAAAFAAVQGFYKADKAFSRGTTTIKAADIEIDIQEFSMQGPTPFAEDGSPEAAQRQIQGMAGQNTPGAENGAVVAENTLTQIMPAHFLDNWEVHMVLGLVGQCESSQSVRTQLKMADGKISLKGMTTKYNLPPTLNALRMVLDQSRANDLLNEGLLDEYEHARLEQYPLISQEKSCAQLADGETDSLETLILSRTYSSDCAATKAHIQKAAAVAETPYVRDVLNVITTGISRGESYPAVETTTHYPIKGMTFVEIRKDPLKIVHCQDEIQLSRHSKDLPREIGGYYSTKYNVVTFSGNATDNSFTPFFIHEAAHAAMNILFRNTAKPYKESDLEQQQAYERAEVDCFKNVARSLGVKEEDLSELAKTHEVITLIEDESRRPPRSELKLSKDDEQIIREFSSLISGYSRQDIVVELIVRIPQLVAMGVSNEIIEKHFKPMMNYWDRFISEPLAVCCEN